MKFTLRKAEEKDFDITHTIKIDAMKNYITQTWGWDEELQRKFHKEEFYSDNIFMVEVDGKPVGTIGINEMENELMINRIYLMKNFQSKGIGSSLLKKVIEENKDKVIKLGVLKVNERAKKLYESMGFEVYGEGNEHWKMKLKGTNNTVLNSERLIFTKYTESDYGNFKKLLMSDDVMKNITGKGLSETETKEKFESVMEANSTMPEIGYYYMTQKSDEAYIGLGKLTYFKHEKLEKNTDTVRAEIGYLLLPDFWGKKYASEITARLIQHAIEVSKIKELIGIVNLPNQASKKVLTNNGFLLQEKDFYRGVIAEYYKLELM